MPCRLADIIREGPSTGAGGKEEDRSVKQEEKVSLFFKENVQKAVWILWGSASFL